MAGYMAYLGVLAFVAFIIGWNLWFNGRYMKMIGRTIFGGKKTN
jgi:hypothetical protein